MTGARFETGQFFDPSQTSLADGGGHGMPGGELPAAQHAAPAKRLRGYCKLDTLAMVRVYGALKRKE